MNFVDVLSTKGPNVLGPLKTNNEGGIYFYAAHDGIPVLRESGFGPESSFATEAEALEFAKGYAEHLKKPDELSA